MEDNTFIENASYNWSEDSTRLIVSPSRLAKLIYFYVQEIGDFKTTHPYFTERRNLNSFLIVYTISGGGLLRYEGNEYELHAGQCFFINCINYHYYETPENGNWEFLWIHFNANNALGYYNEFVKNGFKIINISDTFYVESTLRRILALNRKKDMNTELISSNLISNLLTELLVECCTDGSPFVYIPLYVKETMKNIESGFKEHLSLDYFAKTYSISKFYLSREFKKFTGTTINEYIINTRISYAKELLKYSGLSVNEIAFETGINHVSHFINLFKARENMTPLAFRKEWKG